MKKRTLTFKRPLGYVAPTDPHENGHFLKNGIFDINVQKKSQRDNKLYYLCSSVGIKTITISATMICIEKKSQDGNYE